jgi:hypothetical protein
MNRRFNQASVFKPGDQPPQGYVAWHEWAAVQHRAGMRQRQCQKCGLWRYPQEVCDHGAKQ